MILAGHSNTLVSLNNLSNGIGNGISVLDNFAPSPNLVVKKKKETGFGGGIKSSSNAFDGIRATGPTDNCGTSSGYVIDKK